MVCVVINSYKQHNIVQWTKLYNAKLYKFK